MAREKGMGSLQLEKSGPVSPSATSSRNMVYYLEMTKGAQEFLDRVAGAIEVPAVSPDTDFRAGPLWDSLTAFALRVMIQQRFGKALSAAELEECKTVADLMAAAGVEP